MNYYDEIETIIKKNEVSKKVRIIEENQSTLDNYWQIGKLLVEAQGGSSRAKYGDNLIKEWSKIFTEKYGSNYNYTNLTRFRQFYLAFPILAALRQVSWTQLKIVLPIKNKNKRNYYINLCIKNSLSSRELIKEIKDNSYERLVNKSENIEIINSSHKLSIVDNLKNPILIETDKKVLSEHDLEIVLLANLQVFFSQLGEGYLLAGNQYKINYNNKNYYIDILLFNIEFMCYVVVELKLRELRKEDKAQTEFYMNLVDEELKESHHNKTIGIIISKHQDKFIANFVRNDNLIPITYEIKKK